MGVCSPVSQRYPFSSICTLLCANLWCAFSFLEIDVGIICSSLLALPAFLDKHKPESWGISILRLGSYFSNKSWSLTRKDASGNSHKTTNVAPTNEQYSGNSNRTYKELNEEPSLPNLRGDMANNPNYYHASTHINGEKRDVDEIPLTDGVSVTRTVDVRQDIPMHVYNRV
jgi:hypothetical protein